MTLDPDDLPLVLLKWRSAGRGSRRWWGACSAGHTHGGVRQDAPDVFRWAASIDEGKGWSTGGTSKTLDDAIFAVHAALGVGAPC